MEGKDLNRLKVVLAEKKRTNKQLAEQIGVDQAHRVQMVYQQRTTQLREPDGDSQMLGGGYTRTAENVGKEANRKDISWQRK